MRPAKVEPAIVADALVAVFRRDGYAGASLRDLAAATGLKAASLYHRFRAGKSDMALAALACAGEHFADLVITPLEGDGAPANRLAKSARGLVAVYAGGEQACLLAVLALSDAPPNVRDTVTEMLSAWRAALTTTLADLGVPNAAAAAEDRIAAIHGALIVRRAGLGSDIFARAIEKMGETK